MTPEQWQQVENLGIAGVLTAAFIVALVRGTIVLGREYRALREDRDMWRQLALNGTQLAGRAVDVAALNAQRATTWQPSARGPEHGDERM